SALIALHSATALSLSSAIARFTRSRRTSTPSGRAAVKASRCLRRIVSIADFGNSAIALSTGFSLPPSVHQTLAFDKRLDRAICLCRTATLLRLPRHESNPKGILPMAQFSAADPVVILSYARTPMGGMQGALADVSATDLGATAVKAAVERAGVAGEDIDRIYMGCVLPAGLGQAPARQAALKAGLPKSVQATTVNKVCGSGMQTVIMGAEALAVGNADLIVAGGMESMTNAPYLLKKHRSGARIGHDTAYDHMFLDGLEDAYEEGRAMGTFAQTTADEYQLTRAEMDEYAIASLTRANDAIQSGAFVDEVVPVVVKTRKGEVTVDTDEQPGKGNPAKIPELRPAFARDGTITAATSSSISDGAAALVLTRESVAQAQGK